MAKITKRIGLSLGADICWPICYEELVRRLDLSVPVNGDTVSVEVERISIEPFSLRQGCRYDVVIDRLTHWFYSSREWIKKAVLMDDLYVFNNPWSIQSMEKHTSYCAMMRLGLPVPDTWLIPQKSYQSTQDLERTLRYAHLFDLDQIGAQLGYPSFLKPYDGGAWVGVSKIDNAADLHAAYDQSGTRLMHLQKAVLPHDLFVRCIGLGPQLRPVSYDPDAPLHDRYRPESGFLDADSESLLHDITLTINSFFGWDFNSCEALLQEGQWYPIDFANACPDSQVTSLHYHFPWLVLANIRWSIFCAVAGRRMQRNLDWAPFLEIADSDRSYREKVSAYADIAHERFETDRFLDFCDAHLGHLNELAWEFFGCDLARDAIREKVSALYPPQEIEEFTELFWRRIQRWRREQEQLA
ncbi:MAG: hypothetical protein AMJ59_02715 [Gammaproteobacteria bacterium SG8_31]|nr:MAG: hypothetical protein AMJ59_02715 [Gammaproteobacteria bacterium SG8_31]